MKREDEPSYGFQGEGKEGYGWSVIEPSKLEVKDEGNFENTDKN